jgi:hypothetical protein
MAKDGRRPGLGGGDVQCPMSYEEWVELMKSKSIIA